MRMYGITTEHGELLDDDGQAELYLVRDYAIERMLEMDKSPEETFEVHDFIIAPAAESV